MFVEMNVFGFTIDTLTQKPVVLLKDAREDSTMPIWISSTEAISIAAELLGRDSAIHADREDLMATVLKHMNMSIERIALDRFSEGGFTAAVTLRHQEDSIMVRVRASEAIIASLKYRMPVLVSADVMAQASVDALSDEAIAKENDARRFVDYLESLKPEELGKYPM